MRKVCETCDHFPSDNHCLGCLYDDVTGGNTKWELRNDANVIDRKVIEDIKTEIQALPKIYPFVNHIDTYVKTDDVIKIIERHCGGDKE